MNYDPFSVNICDSFDLRLDLKTCYNHCALWSLSKEYNKALKVIINLRKLSMHCRHGLGLHWVCSPNQWDEAGWEIKNQMKSNIFGSNKDYKDKIGGSNKTSKTQYRVKIQTKNHPVQADFLDYFISLFK